MKHAYLILAHNNFNQLQILINLLDDERNDLYVHIDKKVKLKPILTTNKSKLTILQKIDVRWGDISIVEAELLLFETALSNKEDYLYLHLISGADLPIKSNDFIHSYFQKNINKEFISISPINESELQYRVSKYHFFTKYYKKNNRFIHKLKYITERIVNSIYKRSKNENYTFKKGSQWASITKSFCSYIIENKKYILKRYKYCCCPDEIYKQSLIYNSKYKNNIYDQGNTRLIDWDRCNEKKDSPYVWGAKDSDLDIIINSPAIFARKFDIEKYPSIIHNIYNYINNLNNH